MSKLLSSLVVASLFGLAAVAHAQPSPVLDKIRSEKKLVIAHRESSVPFSYLDANKKPIGYAVDICVRLAEAVKKHLGLDKLEVEYLMATPANRIELIKTGKAHFECGSTTNNATRREEVAFTIPHFITGARLMVRADSAVERIQDLRSRKVVSTAKTTPLEAVKRHNQEHLLKLEILEAPDHARAMAMVEKGEADAFVMDDVLLYGLIASNGKDKELKVTGRFMTTEPLAIMLPKGDAAFKKVVDNEMRRLIFSYEIHALYKKWFETPIPPKGVALNMPASYFLKDFWKYPTDVVPF